MWFYWMDFICCKNYEWSFNDMHVKHSVYKFPRKLRSLVN